MNDSYYNEITNYDEIENIDYNYIINSDYHEINEINYNLLKVTIQTLNLNKIKELIPSINTIIKYANYHEKATNIKSYKIYLSTLYEINIKHIDMLWNFMTNDDGLSEELKNIRLQNFNEQNLTNIIYYFYNNFLLNNYSLDNNINTKYEIVIYILIYSKTTSIPIDFNITNFDHYIYMTECNNIKNILLFIINENNILSRHTILNFLKKICNKNYYNKLLLYLDNNINKEDIINDINKLYIDDIDKLNNIDNLYQIYYILNTYNTDPNSVYQLANYYNNNDNDDIRFNIWWEWDSTIISKYLRNKKINPYAYPYIMEFDKDIENAFKELDPIIYPIIVFRGVDKKLPFKCGGEFDTRSYFSTSININVANNFAHTILYKIKLLPGTKITTNNEWCDLGEFLVNKGGYIKCKTTKLSDGRYFSDCVYGPEPISDYEFSLLDGDEHINCEYVDDDREHTNYTDFNLPESEIHYTHPRIDRSSNYYKNLVQKYKEKMKYSTFGKKHKLSKKSKKHKRSKKHKLSKKHKRSKKT